jgi:hypothetical protein
VAININIVSLIKVAINNIVVGVVKVIGYKLLIKWLLLGNGHLYSKAYVISTFII